MRRKWKKKKKKNKKQKKKKKKKKNIDKSKYDIDYKTPVLMNHTKARQIESTPDASPYKNPREPQETITRPKSPYKNSREPWRR
ncbi:hypothetical protein ElyMa_000464600 [Elysia marginata]|uniref:Uncharacterized protein n=1 Tax=Elysia marginata TaxID=1093978 RepID=A0AAV4FU43_9GAST|nr:hypothetical protein ElyMa_000464600 [Elysia marginata]